MITIKKIFIIFSASSPPIRARVHTYFVPSYVTNRTAFPARGLFIFNESFPKRPNGFMTYGFRETQRKQRVRIMFRDFFFFFLESDTRASSESRPLVAAAAADSLLRDSEMS